MPQINVGKILTLLKEHNLLVTSDLSVNLGADFTQVTYDSRQVTEQTLFFCKGNFKVEFLESAQAKGAQAYVSEQRYETNLPAIIVTNIQQAMAVLGAAFYDFPQNKLNIIAYTGTKGKTTAAYFTNSIMQQRFTGQTALFSTINTVVGNKMDDTFKSSLTTPESLDLFKNMDRAVNNEMQQLVMEVSSQAYKKDRVYNLKYDIGVFLNISPDHLGKNEHPTFADYLHCKEQLLVNSKVCVINAETQHLRDVYGAAKATSQPEDIYLFARKGAEITDNIPVDVEFEAISDTLTDNVISVSAVSEKAKQLNLTGQYELSLPGDFNEVDATAAIITSALSGLSQDDIRMGLQSTVVPGRMETYETNNHGTVYVDYAHNYASFHSLLGYLKSQAPNGRIIVVTGSTGDKGEDRRYGIGKAIGESADVALLTVDDPGTEDPAEIARTIADNIQNTAVKHEYVADRKTAVEQAIEMSTPDDLVVIAGKGHDPYQKINNQDVPYESDSVIVKQFVKGM